MKGKTNSFNGILLNQNGVNTKSIYAILIQRLDHFTLAKTNSRTFGNNLKIAS